MAKKNETIKLVYGARPQHTTRARRERDETKHELYFLGLLLIGVLCYIVIAGGTR